MKLLLVIVFAGAVGCLVGLGLMNRLREEEHSRFRTEQAAWQAEKAELEAAIERERAESTATPIFVSRTQTVAVATRPAPFDVSAIGVRSSVEIRRGPRSRSLTSSACDRAATRGLS